MSKRTWRYSAPLIFALGLPFFFWGCDSGGGITDPTGSSTVTLSVSGLQPVSGGLNYQAWLVHESGPNTYGYPLVLFNIDANGRMVDPVADTVLTGPYRASVATGSVLGLTISLELTSQLKEVSSFTFILSGELVQGTANLTVGDFFAHNRDYSSVEGLYVLATPTDEDPDNELSGIWFMDSSSDPVEAGLGLPQSPNGWIYEGWVQVDEEPVSTGRFVWGEEADSTSYYSGPLEHPFFPGEDFLFNPPQGIDFPLDLSGADVFVTIEPWHDWDTYPEEPFFLKILEGQVPGNALPQTVYTLTSAASQFPTGTATVK